MDIKKEITDIAERFSKEIEDMKRKTTENKKQIEVMWMRIEMLENVEPYKKPEPDIISTPIEQYKRDHKTPRVGQLCYVWDNNVWEKRIEIFSRFDKESRFVDKRGWYWRNWSFIPRGDIE